MKKLIPLIFSFCFLFSYNESKATHVMGMDVNWKCLGNDTFKITVIVYRRCTDGAVAMSSSGLAITSDSCTNAYTAIIDPALSYTVEDITPVCRTQQKLCPISGGNGTSTAQIPVGVERHTWVYKVYLGGNLANCCWYKIHWEQCCRNSNITTGYADAGFSSDSWLNRCVSSCNNSPEFKNPPIIIKCAGQDVCYNHGVYDPDGDSLSYTMVSPLGGSYASPWSNTYPLTCYGGNNPDVTANPITGFNINPINGDLCFRPMQAQITVLKMMVTEWRRNAAGTLEVIGKVARDMQFAIIANCNNKLPSLAGPYNYESCPGEQICITINTGDQDATDSTGIFWNKGIPGATWTDNNDSAKNASGTLCWTPSESNSSSIPYYFTAAAIDNHCPLIGITTRSYSIKVLIPPTKPTITQNYTTMISSHGYLYQWYSNNNPINGATDSSYTTVSPGIYKVKVTDSKGCSSFSDVFTFAVGIKANALNTKIKISPNPFHDQLYVEIKDFNKEVLISLYDMQGKLISQQQTPVSTTIDTMLLSPGMYLLEVSDGENKTVFKVGKQ